MRALLALPVPKQQAHIIYPAAADVALYVRHSLPLWRAGVEYQLNTHHAVHTDAMALMPTHVELVATGGERWVAGKHKKDPLGTTGLRFFKPALWRKEVAELSAGFQTLDPRTTYELLAPIFVSSLRQVHQRMAQVDRAPTAERKPLPDRRAIQERGMVYEEVDEAGQTRKRKRRDNYYGERIKRQRLLTDMLAPGPTSTTAATQPAQAPPGHGETVPSDAL